MQKLTGFNLISVVNRIPKGTSYPLPDETGDRIEVVRVELPEGPIVLRKLSSSGASVDVLIDKQIIWRVANNLFEAQPLSLVRLLGIDPLGKARLLEAILAYTSEFYICFPGRMEHIAGNTVDKRGEQYIIWLPGEPHEHAKLSIRDYSADISELPVFVAVYEALEIKGAPKLLADKPNVEILRRHIQIQTALYHIGVQLGYRVYFRRKDDGIYLNNVPITEANGIISRLDDVPPFADNPAALKLAEEIDIIWFAEDGSIVAAISVEFYKSISVSVMRMLELKNLLQKGDVKRFVIAAPDEDRAHTISVSTKAFNSSLMARYFSFSCIEELFSLCRRRGLKGVSEEFLDCFIEKI
ncbi:MAG: hypothetical protein LBP51_00995 [Deferribacteraceae bacterium]|nr:hypothetical protein [Deferribacteraceae bacterium]